MGVWGWKPFQNDYVLDTFGELRNRAEILKVIKETFSNGAYFVPSYEIGALLCDSFNKTHYAADSKKIEQIMEIIRGNGYLGNILDMLHESLCAVISVCTIDMSTRKKLLGICKGRLTKNIIEAIDNDEEDEELTVNMREVGKNIEAILSDFENSTHTAFLISSSEFNKLDQAVKKLNQIPQVKCQAKFKDAKGVTKGYRLEDCNRVIKDVTHDELKYAILNYQIIVTNLKIAADGRIINKESETDIQNIQV